MENISPKNRKIWFITGASKGLGLELAKQLLATGHQVAATTRRLATLEGALGRENDNFLPLEADLINEVSVKNAVAKTVQKFGTVDVIVNNAGYGQFGYIEEISDSLVRKQFDVNVFGTLNVVRAALPALRKQRSGHIFNISSMAGYTGFPGAASTAPPNSPSMACPNPCAMKSPTSALPSPASNPATSAPIFWRTPCSSKIPLSRITRKNAKPSMSC